MPKRSNRMLAYWLSHLVALGSPVQCAARLVICSLRLSACSLHGRRRGLLGVPGIPSGGGVLPLMASCMWGSVLWIVCHMVVSS